MRTSFMICLGAFFLVSCSPGKPVPPPSKPAVCGRHRRSCQQIGKLTGKEGLVFRIGGEACPSKRDVLFQAALGVLSSYPLAVVDAQTRLIVTNWKTEPSGVRTKVTVRLVEEQVDLRVFTQTYRSGTWWDTPSALEHAAQLREEIVRKASSSTALSERKT